MNRQLKLLTLLALALSFSAFATTKPLSSDLGSRIGTGDQYVQYLAKGSAIADSGSIWVAIVDLQRNIINVTTRDQSLRDSSYHEFIPGNTFKVSLSGELSWSEEEGSFTYSYELHSDTSSLTLIDFLRLEKRLDCKQMLGPPGWAAADFAKDYEWSQVRENTELRPGKDLSGFGLKTACPPRIGSFEIWGKSIEIRSSGWDEVSWSIAGGAEFDNHGIIGATIVPGPCPEMIEPVDLVDSMIGVLWTLVENGYMSADTKYSVHAIFNNLKGAMLHRSEHKFQNLEQHVNDALNALEQYHEVMQPEAWGYITENLKYMLKHPDIIVFKRAMWD